jgi:hypothetical protein
MLLSRIWRDWRSALALVKPETVIGWYRKRFSCSGPGRIGGGIRAALAFRASFAIWVAWHSNPATATKNQTERHLEMDVLTTASADSLSCEGCLRHRLGKPQQRCRLPLRASIERLLCGDPWSRPTCHFELHRARQPLRWPMAAEFGQPGNFHPTLQISLSPRGTGRRSKTSLSTTIYRADVGQPKAALYAPGRGILACASMTVIGSFTFRQITPLISTKVPECDVPTFHGESHRGFAEYQVGSGGRRTELQA